MWKHCLIVWHFSSACELLHAFNDYDLSDIFYHKEMPQEDRQVNYSTVKKKF